MSWVASALLVITAPLLAMIAVAIRIVDGRPVLFRQTRSGSGGRPFEFVKFRTMRPARSDEIGPQHDMARLTRMGRVLRATSIDELPTLAHVVRGDMSLVGPRPLPVSYLPRYDDTQARRLEVRPGVTGWAQVNGRNTTPWGDRLAMDVWYVDHASLRLDVRILARTVGMVLHRTDVDHAPGVTMTEFAGPAAPTAGLPARPLRVAHLTTVDMSLALLLEAQLDAVVAAGGEAIGISAPGPFVAAIEQRGVRHIPLHASTRSWSLRSDLRSALELWQILRRERPTVLHTHNPKPGAYGRVVGRLAGVPIVANTIHGLYATPTDPRLRRVLVYSLEAFAARWSDVELVQNIEDVELIRRRRLVPARKLRHLGNGVDLQRFHPERTARERAEVRAAWGIDEGTVVVGTVGRLVAEKGYVELFEAVAELGPGVRLVVIGGPDAERPDALDPIVLQRARASGVVLLGHRDDVELMLAGFDLFVLASHREGQPRAAMEAAAAGLPIVATDVRGCRQVVDDGSTGLLVPVADVHALRTAIGVLAASPERRREMGAAGRAKAEHEFDERDVVRRVMDAYAWAAGRRGIRLE